MRKKITIDQMAWLLIPLKPTNACKSWPKIHQAGRMQPNKIQISNAMMSSAPIAAFFQVWGNRQDVPEACSPKSGVHHGSVAHARSHAREPVNRQAMTVAVAGCRVERCSILLAIFRMDCSDQVFFHSNDL